MAKHSPSSERTGDGRLKPYAAKKRLRTNSRWPEDEQAAAYIILLGESLGFWGRRTLTGFTVTKKEDGWLLIVKALHKGKPEVSFTHAATYQEAIKEWANGLVYDLVKWRPDQFKPRA